ncbi:MAG TPA: HEAT repeat domain-containing protein [Vicinamibacterales bacterium]|nr:HEAT repeat domain-containing protein [Vicinamibacterales bacterium]
MADVPTLPPELCRSVAALARTLVAAARTWALYPPDHPAVRGAMARLGAAIAGATGDRPLALGITPDDLLIDGIAVAGETIVAEAAWWLHQRDLVQITFLGDAAPGVLQRLLALLAEDPAAMRARGGPAKAWAESGDAAVVLEQIDFARVLEDRAVEHPARRKDDLWRAIVRAVLDKRRALDEAAQARLLEIAHDVVAIGELAQDVIAPHYSADGSPMLTSQAAAVVAAYRHLAGIVDVLAPERRDEVIQNLAAATANLDPTIVLQMLHGATQEPGRSPADGTTPPPILAGVVNVFDDLKVAQLLATTLAIDGQASERLASVFDTIAPDAERKRRVLTLTQSLLGETDFGRQDRFKALWSSMESLLLTYNERPFVSAQYRVTLDTIGARAGAMAGAELPDDLAALVGTLDQENVRRLSIALLIDLLRLETDPQRAPDLARDVAALAEDLLLAGDYGSAATVSGALAAHAADPASVAAEACRVAIDALVSTVAFHEAAELLPEMTPEAADEFAQVCAHVGPAATEALRDYLETEELTPARARATAIIRGYESRAISRLSPLMASERWAAQRNAAELLALIGAPEGVPLLQPLLRGADPRVTRAAVRALATIRDPAAARAVHTVLRAATGAQRRAVVDALVAERDARVVPVLIRILEESDPFGSDHPIVLDALAALGTVGDDEAVPVLSTMMRRRRLLGRRKLRAVKHGAVTALRTIGSPEAAAALIEAERTGDRLLRRIARQAPAEAHG